MKKKNKKRTKKNVEKTAYTPIYYEFTFNFNLPQDKLTRRLRLIYDKVGHLYSVSAEPPYLPMPERMWLPHQDFFPAACPQDLVERVLNKFKKDVEKIDPQYTYTSSTKNPLQH